MEKTKDKLFVNGEEVTEFPFEATARDGEKLVVTGFRAGTHPGSSGRIFTNGGFREYFPSVINGEIRRG